MDDLPLDQPKKGMPGWVIALIVVGVAGLCAIPAIVGAVAVLVPKIQHQQTRTLCAGQLRNLGAAFHSDKLTRGGLPNEGGARYFLGLARLAGGDGKMLVCPGDPHAAPGAIVKVGDGPQDPAMAPVFRAMCSYMVRDFERYPLDPDIRTPQMIAADSNDHGAHHGGGINVLHDDGSVRFLDRDSLGVFPDDPIVVGPDSPHPELRKLCIVPAR